MSLTAQLTALRAEKVPSGWFTQQELAVREKRQTTHGAFYYIVRDAVAAGLLEMKVFRIATRAGIRRTAHYRYLKKG